MNALCIFFAGKCHVSEAVNMIHGVITIPGPFPYTAKFMFVGVRHKKRNKSDVENRIRTYCCRI